MKRRQYLAVLGTGSVASVAGCMGLLETEQRSVRMPPLVDNRPSAVYIPTHVEGMEMAGMKEASRLRLALSYSFPHRFWTVDIDRTNQVSVQSDDSAHLMVSVWDGETNTVIPTSNASVTVTQNGSTVTQKDMWPMLSQNMGFHYGDNVQLDGDGTYEVNVRFGPVGTRRTGAFRDQFGEQATPAFTMEFSQSKLEALMFERLSDREGNRGAVAPMDMEMMPIPQLPKPDGMPGSILGTGTSGDAKFVATVLDSPPAGVEGSGSYLAVSARTPHNRFPIPMMSMTATVSGGDESKFDGPLTSTLDPNLKYHYGAVVDGIESGDTITITPQSVPQVARHEGYEMAFLDMSEMELTVEG
ncbi:Fe2+ transport protein [Halorientalis persicus]|uniref:Fe2+ transport protein n=1 Tax=Halorientalis persicus TaxID=1367881 RepID=A0A1H8Q8V7_9EURY|nr:iron transporter [Halorientalis persicus]SEO50401.1 Fe2+ transport protein [Halorientalis persicus]